MSAIVNHVVVQPLADAIVALVLASVQNGTVFEAELDTAGIERPWRARRSVHVRVRQILVLDDGWIRVSGEPAGLADWSSITMTFWHGHGAPGPLTSFEGDLVPGGPAPAPARWPATASLVMG